MNSNFVKICVVISGKTILVDTIDLDVCLGIYFSSAMTSIDYVFYVQVQRLSFLSEETSRALPGLTMKRLQNFFCQKHSFMLNFGIHK